MSRIARDSRLETREARKSLPTNQHNEPLWKQIHPGLFVGYYRGAHGGTWYMRRRIEKDGKKVYEKTRLGIADDYQDANGADVLSYSQAHKIIFEKADQAITISSNYTVGDAANDYLAWFKVNSKSYYVTEKTVKAHILSKLESRKLETLTVSEITK